ncbi:TPA: FRG domain-containing protein [Vibrio parahaemolyticus]|nr:FRG domain-containing protein [Vibrio parahaemolyticus]
MKKTIRSISEALTFLYELQLNKGSLFFRGQADYTWKLKPTIYRTDDFLNHQCVQYENNSLRLKPNGPLPPLLHTSYEIEWLMLCQHYGVPTRLLDWSHDILTSLYFACSELPQKNAALFICFANDYPQYSAYDVKINNVKDLAFINTYIINPRVRAQSGAFMIWGNSPLNKGEGDSYDLESYINHGGSTKSLIKLKIPKNAKKAILADLKTLYTVSEDTIYLKNNSRDKNIFENVDFDEIKRISKLLTLYHTNAELLSSDDENEAFGILNRNERNMFKGTKSQTW